VVIGSDILSYCQVVSIRTLVVFSSLYNIEKTLRRIITILFETVSLVGATVIFIGFYSVMWGQAKKEKVGVDNRVRGIESGILIKVPSLQSHPEETCKFCTANQRKGLFCQMKLVTSISFT
jgi:hypothetical protein